MGTISGPFSIPDGLMYHIDPSNPKSYAGYGTIIYDMSGNGNTSYFTNGALYQNYQKGTVLVDGNNDYIAFPLFNLTSPFTVSVWAKNVNSESPIFGGYGSGVGYGNAEYIFYYEPDSFSMSIQGTGDYRKFIFPTPKYNIWYNFVLTRDVSNNVKMYRNGIGSTSNPHSYSNTFQINQIGRYSNFTNQYNPKGHLGETRIYNRALSDQEVLQNYNATKKRYLPEENIVTNGLVFNLDAANPSSYVGSGNTAYDLSGFGNTSTLVNGPGFGVTGGGMFVFDGTNDYFEAQHSSSLNISGSITVDVWVYLTSLSNSADMNLICKYSNAGGSSNQSWILFKSTGDYRSASPDGLTGNNNEFVWLSSSNGNYSGALIGTGEQVLTNTWYNVVAIYNSSTEKMQMYINGQLKTNVTRTGQTSGVLSTNLRNLQVGGTPLDSNRWVQGRIPISRVYNRALTAQEISQNFNATKSRYNI
jgi:hypothetical protein